MAEKVALAMPMSRPLADGLHCPNQQAAIQAGYLGLSQQQR